MGSNPTFGARLAASNLKPGFSLGRKERPSRGLTPAGVTVSMNNVFHERRAQRAKDFLCRLFKTARLTKFLGSLLILAALSTTVEAGQSVNFGWVDSPTPSVTGYNLIYGEVSQTYTNLIDVGNVTNAVISDLVAGTTYYFAVEAYDASGSLSIDSTEISYTVPIIAPAQIQATQAVPLILTVTGVTGQTYDIQATPDFKTWTVIGTVTAGPSGSFNFTDTNWASFPSRFYRTRQ